MQKELIFVVAAIVFGAFLRLIFAAWPKSKLWDGLGVLSKIEAQKGKWWPSYTIPDAVNHGGLFPRPALFHFIISKFPRKWWRAVSVMMNIGFDITLGLILYLILKFRLSINLSPIQWMLGLSVFYSAPILLPVTARMKSTNNRSLGLFLASLYFILLYCSLHCDHRYWFVLILIYFLVIIGSTFAMQAVIFITAVFSIITLDFIPIIAIIVMTAILYVIKPARVRAILLFKYHHVKQYLTERKYSFSTARRNLVPNFFKVLNPFEWSKTTRNIQLLLYDAPIWIALYSVPLLIYILIRYGGRFLSMNPAEPSHFLLAICISSTIVFLITSFGKAKVFGESERYFEFAWPFAITYVLIAGIQADWLAIILIGHLSILLIIHFLSSREAFAQLFLFSNYDSNINHVLDYLISTNSRAKIATIPIRYSRMLSSVNTNKSRNDLKFYYQMIVSDNDTMKFTGFEDEVMLKNFFKATPLQLNEKYGIEYIVVDNSLLQSKLPSYQKYLDQLELLNKFGEFVIYKISI